MVQVFQVFQVVQVFHGTGTLTKREARLTERACERLTKREARLTFNLVFRADELGIRMVGIPLGMRCV